VTKYAGLVRDASDGEVKLFKDATTKPTNSVDFSQAGIAYADLRVGTLKATSITSSSAVTFPAGLSVSGGLTVTGTSDVQEMRETVVDVTLASNVGTLDWTAGNIYIIGTAPTANMTFNATNVPTDSSKAMTINVLVTQGSTGYIPTTFQINGTNQPIRWNAGAAPIATSSAGKIDIFTFTLIRTSASTWLVLGSTNANF